MEYGVDYVYFVYLGYACSYVVSGIVVSYITTPFTALLSIHRD